MKYEDVLKNYALSESAYSSTYEACRSDYNFMLGIGQWEERASKIRKQAGKPILTLNQLLPYGDQVVNDIRQARLAIRVSPVDSNADVNTAEVLSGIIRNIERRSSFNNVVSTAAFNAVGAGLGWMRISTDYADENSFDQEVLIERVLDFESVYLDPNSQEIDGSDAEYAFIFHTYSKEKFEELYPDEQPVSFAGKKTSNGDVCVAEYFCKKYEDDKLYQVRLIDGSIQTINTDQKKSIDEDGTVYYEILMERDTKYCKVMRYIYAGGEDALEEEEFPSKYIPIVPVIGKEVYVDGQREMRSLIRPAKDAQRMYNYHKSEATYLMALQPKTPYVGPKGSFSSNANKWAAANNENFAFLEYDVVYGKNGERLESPQRQPAPQGSTALLQEALSAKEDIRTTIGMTQANMGERSNEVSGIAVRARQLEGDNATFHFIDNLATSIAQVGRILIDIIPRIYNQPRIARIIGEDGVEKNVPINQPYKKGEDGNPMPEKSNTYDGIYDLSMGKYDVVADVGASYSSKRQETADKLIQLISAKPELADITGDLLFEALELPMGKEIAERIRSTMSPELLGDDPQAMKLKQAAQALEQMQERLMNYEAALQEKQEDKEFDQQVKLKELEHARAKLEIEAAKAQADIQKMQAETQNTNADTAAFMGELSAGVRELFERVEDYGETLTIMLDAEEARQNEAVNAPETVEETSTPELDTQD